MNNKTENRCTEALYRRSVQDVLYRRICTGVLYRRSVQDFTQVVEAVQNGCYKHAVTKWVMVNSVQASCTGPLLQRLCTYEFLYRPSVQACTGLLYRRPVQACIRVFCNRVVICNIVFTVQKACLEFFLYRRPVQQGLFFYRNFWKFYKHTPY